MFIKFKPKSSGKEDSERNIREDEALLKAEETIKNLAFQDEPAAQNFREDLKNRILAVRHHRFSMPELWEKISAGLIYLFKPKIFVPAVATFLLVAIVAAGLPFWLIGEKNNQIARSPFAGFSKLIINSASAEENFILLPQQSDSLGVDSASAYVLKSKTPLELNLIKQNLAVEPKFAYDIKQSSSTEWLIIPKEPVAPDTVVKFYLPASYVNSSGQETERDYSWAFQIKNSFKVISSIPREGGTGVPTDSGIEITFTHDNFTDFDKFFSIDPQVKGRFEQHGRTMVFVPEEHLAPAKIYTVKIAAGLPLAGATEKLGADYKFSFETEGVNSAYNSWLYAYRRFQEVGPDENPIIQLYANEVPDNKVDVNVYRFASESAYLDALKKRDNLPWWAYSKSDFLLDTQGMQKFGSYSLAIKDQDRVSYVELPANFPIGFYIVEFSNAANKANREQVWLQSSNLSAYLNITKTATLTWVNDLSTKAPAAGVSVSLLDSPSSAVTDSQGIAKFVTPKQLITDAFDYENYQRYYFLLHRGNDDLVVGAYANSDGWWGYGGNSSSIADDFWYYVYTDRPRYQSNDVVNYWGLLKNRSGEMPAGDVTVTLYKEGYVDYYYRPVKILENKVSLSDYGTFTGQMKLENVRPDYYTLEIKVGDQVIATKYIEVSPYIKPAYQIDLGTDKTYLSVGDTLNLKGKASFFEGTPVPEMALDFVSTNASANKGVTTDANGEVALTYKEDYQDQNCGSNESWYNCWPHYVSFSLAPKNSEEAEISASADAVIYGPNVYLNTQVKYPEKGKAEINFDSRLYDFARLNSGEAYDRKEDKVAPNTKIELTVYKITYTKTESGTYYDFIDKRTYKNYYYNRNTEAMPMETLYTDANGKAVKQLSVSPETSYIFDYKFYDASGRFDRGADYGYYYDGERYYDYSNGDNSYYYLKLNKVGSYKEGEQVGVQLLRGDSAIASGNSKFLFMKMQNGLQDYTVTNQPEYQFNFSAADIPNTNLAGVYFNGRTYVLAGGANVIFDNTQRKLNLDISTDKEKYRPGENVKLSVKVTGPDNSGRQAAVNLNLVDEAYYAIANDFADPTSGIYRYLSSGSLDEERTDLQSNAPMSGAERGGCFVGGTKVLLSDGSWKEIEKIKTGDNVKTFADPGSRQLVDGKVTATFEHLVDGYLLINDHLRVTPEHLIYASGAFREAGLLKPGDLMLNYRGQIEEVKSIKKIGGLVKVYNLTIDPQHTYFADGIYVHNDKGGGVREVFQDVALFKEVQTDASGRATVEFKLPDNITSWRVTAQALTKDLYVGANTKKIPVSLPVFIQVDAGNQYLTADQPSVKLRAYGTALQSGDAVQYQIGSTVPGTATTTLSGQAFTATDFNLPKMALGNYDFTYWLSSARGNDAVKLPVSVVSSRLTAEFANHEKLAPGFKVKSEGDLPITVVLADEGQNKLYWPLVSLSYEWGDRVDQKMARREARIMLDKYYQEKFDPLDISAFNYQTSDGGISLLPYSSSDLELSARVVSVSAEGFDRESLQQYFFNKLENQAATPEEVSYSLYGLASLGEPVLPRINEWLKRQDLSVKEKLYLAQGLFNLGAAEQARTIYQAVIAQYAQKHDSDVIIRTSDNQDEVFQNTAIAAVLAASLGAPEQEGLFNYYYNNQVLYGSEKNSENLLALEKIAYVSRALPNLKPSPAEVKYRFLGKDQDVTITGGSVHSFQIYPEQVNDLEFLSVTGDVGVSTIYIRPVSGSVPTDNSISLTRQYLVNGVPTTQFKENDLVEVDLKFNYGSDNNNQYFQITDLLPSGMAPLSNPRAYGATDYSCAYVPPFNSENQSVKFMIYASNWYSCNREIKYFARVKNKGNYLAEPAVMQSILTPSRINFSAPETIVIK